MITTAAWMEQSKDIRDKLRAIFCIPKSSFIWVDGNKVKSDGVTDKDLLALTDDKMQDFSGISGSSYTMFIECVRKLSEIPTEEMVVEVLKNEEIIESTPEAKESILESSSAPSNEPDVSMKCDKCEFVGKNIKSLRLHKIKKH